MDVNAYAFEVCLEELTKQTEASDSDVDAPHETSKPLKRKNSKSKSMENEIKMELALFKNAKLNKSDDPVAWWRENHSHFNILFTIANKYLCSPLSSIESERLFSVGGNVYTPHRNRLKPIN